MRLFLVLIIMLIIPMSVKAEIDGYAENTKRQQTRNAIRYTLNCCESGNEILDTFGESSIATIENATHYYNKFLDSKVELKAFDSSTFPADLKTRLEECEKRFVPRYLTIKEKIQKEEAVIKMLLDAEKQRQVELAAQENKKRAEKALEQEALIQRVIAEKKAERERKAEEAKAKKIEAEAAEKIRQKEAEEAAQKNFEFRKKLAGKYGYKGIVTGISVVIDELMNEYNTLARAKEYLIEQDNYEDFKLLSRVDDLAIYGFEDRAGTFFQIAVKTEPGKFYGSGANLPYGLYAIQETRDFLTVLGTRISVLVLKRVAD